MSKENAIKIIRNLTGTIKKMPNKSIIRKSDNSIFHNPSASKKQLTRKRDELIKKYNIKKEEYAVTKNEG